MLTFLSENLATIIISVALAVLIVLILLKLRKDRKRANPPAAAAAARNVRAPGRVINNKNSPFLFFP